jgi:hypothetical protein
MSIDRLTEVLNYLSAMSRDMGDFRAETKARFDRIETEMRAGFEQTRTDVRHLSRKIELLNEASLDCAHTSATSKSEWTS